MLDFGVTVEVGIAVGLFVRLGYSFNEVAILGPEEDFGVFNGFGCIEAIPAVAGGVVAGGELIRGRRILQIGIKHLGVGIHCGDTELRIGGGGGSHAIELAIQQAVATQEAVALAEIGVVQIEGIARSVVTLASYIYLQGGGVDFMVVTSGHHHHIILVARIDRHQLLVAGLAKRRHCIRHLVLEIHHHGG